MRWVWYMLSCVMHSEVQALVNSNCCAVREKIQGASVEEEETHPLPFFRLVKRHPERCPHLLPHHHTTYELTESGCWTAGYGGNGEKHRRIRN